MKILKITIAVFLLTMIASQVKAQEIKGYAYELISSSPLWNAKIKNLRTQETVETAKDGSFKIAGRINDYLSITNIGYQTDTIYYYEDAIRRIYLNRNENLISIDEVLVTRLTDSRLAVEIAKAKNEGKAVDATQQKGGLRVSPSRLFGKKAKEARNNLSLLIAEQEARQVDRKFTTQLIASLTPLNQDEIALFRNQYRPSLEFTSQASPEDLRIYILDSFKKFKEK